MSPGGNRGHRRRWTLFRPHCPICGQLATDELARMEGRGSLKARLIRTKYCRRHGLDLFRQRFLAYEGQLELLVGAAPCCYFFVPLPELRVIRRGQEPGGAEAGAAAVKGLGKTCEVCGLPAQAAVSMEAPADDQDEAPARLQSLCLRCAWRLLEQSLRGAVENSLELQIPYGPVGRLVPGETRR